MLLQDILRNACILLVDKLLGEAFRLVVKGLCALGLALRGKPGCEVFWQRLQLWFRHILEGITMDEKEHWDNQNGMPGRRRGLLCWTACGHGCCPMLFGIGSKCNRLVNAAVLGISRIR